MAVPATDGDGYVVGVVARAEKSRSLSAAILVYFYGPRWFRVPEVKEVLPLLPEKAISIIMTSCRRIADGHWVEIGSVPEFSRSDWPIPLFGRVSITMPGFAWLVKFAEDEIGRGVKRIETPVSPNEAQRHPPESFSGADIAAFEVTNATKSRRDIH